MNRRHALKTGALALASGLWLTRGIVKADVDALEQDGIKINPYVRPNINRINPYGNEDWDNLTDELARAELMTDALILGGVAKINYNNPKFVCHHYSTLDLLKIHGYKKENPEDPDIPQVFFDKGLTQEQIGEFNLPLYYISVYSPELQSTDFGAHTLVGSPIGNENNGDPRVWDNWKLWEPQNNNIVNIGYKLLPKNSEIFMSSIKKFFSHRDNSFLPTNLVNFIIKNGTPEVTSYINPNLILERPEPVLVEKEEPKQFSLSQNYPNQFNANTKIEYSIDKPGKVCLEIYNFNGQKLETLVNGDMSAGKHIVNWNAKSYSSGTYFYRLRSGNNVEKRKMMLVR